MSESPCVPTRLLEAQESYCVMLQMKGELFILTYALGELRVTQVFDRQQSEMAGSKAT